MQSALTNVGDSLLVPDENGAGSFEVHRVQRGGKVSVCVYV